MGQAAHVQGLDVVSDRRPVLFPGEPVVPFVAGDEGPQMAAGDELLDLFQGGVRAVVVGHRGHIDVVEGAQLVEVEDMGLNEVGALNQVAQDAAVVGDAAVHPVDFVEGEGRRQAVGGRADPADSLHDAGGVTGVAPGEDGFQPAIHHPGTLGLFDHSAVHHRLDLEVSFDAGYRINYNLFCHSLSPDLRYGKPPEAVCIRPEMKQISGEPLKMIED